MSEILKRRMRYAVYTRKSSEEGLDQEYNSIDAQRDAGHAYIATVYVNCRVRSQRAVRNGPQCLPQGESVHGPRDRRGAGRGYGEDRHDPHRRRTRKAVDCRRGERSNPGPGGLAQAELVRLRLVGSKQRARRGFECRLKCCYQFRPSRPRESTFRDEHLAENPRGC